MFTLVVEMHLPDFDVFKGEFDRDLFHRGAAGVLRHRVLRSVEDPNHAIVELDFDDRAKADQEIKLVEILFGDKDTKVVESATIQLFDWIETREY